MSIFNRKHSTGPVDWKINDMDTREIVKMLQDKYSPSVKSVAECLHSFKNLEYVSFGVSRNCFFRYNMYSDEFVCYVEGFGNYAYNRSAKGKEAIRLLDEFYSDFTEFFYLICRENPGTRFDIVDEWGKYDLDRYIKYMKEYINKYGDTPSNSIGIYIRINKRDLNKLLEKDNIKRKHNFMRKHGKR